MRNTFFTLVVLGLFFSCNSAKISNKATQNSPYFIVQIEQNGKIISPTNNVITLNKKPFKFLLTMKGLDGISLGASWDDNLFSFPENKNIFFCDDENTYENCGFFSPNAMASENFNSDKELLVGKSEDQQYWFYDPNENWHRLDKGVKAENGAILATFTVENIFNVLREAKDSLKKKEYTINEIENDIFIVFAAEKPSKDSKSHKELQREKFILRFN